LIESASNALESAGFSRPHSLRSEALVTAQAVVDFTMEPIVLRFFRNRNEDFLEIAPAAHASQFVQFDDVAVALNLRSVEAVLGRTSPEPLADMLRIVRANWSVIEAAFGPERLDETIESIERTTALRASAWQTKMS
jgi:hypothetical protein